MLHTWGQKLDPHPQLHCLVPGGGISPDGSRWIPCRKGFFLPVKVLSRRFRNLFLRMLGKAFDKRELPFHGRLSRLARKGRQQELLRPLRQREWVVYAKPPFQSPRRVLKYLARYTHRVAFSNQRLLRFDPARGRVAFLCKDYRSGSRRTLTLDAAEFIRRFLLHVLPRGLHAHPPLRLPGQTASAARSSPCAAGS